MNKDIIHGLILDFDCNVKSNILVFGSLLFNYINYKDCSFNMDKYRTKAKEYYNYSEKSICEAFRWLEQNGLIYYSKYRNRYFVSDMIKDVLELW